MSIISDHGPSAAHRERIDLTSDDLVPELRRTPFEEIPDAPPMLPQDDVLEELGS